MLKILRALGCIPVQVLAAGAAVSVVLAILVSPLSPLERIQAQSVGPGGVPGRAAGGAVNSVFGRSGSVTAQSGDYTAGQVTHAADVAAPNTFSANQTVTGADKLTFGSATIGVSLSNATAFGAGALQVNDAGSGLFVFNASEPDGNIGDAAFFIPDNSPIVWATPASTPSNPVGALTWVSTGTISLDATGDGSGSGWLMVSAIGSGVSNNTDLRGLIALSSRAGSYTFTKTYTTAPTCVATDTTTAAPIKVTVTTTTLTLTGTGSDVLNYICAD